MTYAIFSAAIVAVTALLTAPTLRQLRGRPIAITALILIGLTAVFDNIIVGVGLVAYDDDLILGLRVPIAPIEDFSYTLAVVMLVPTIWQWLAPKATTASSAEAPEAPEAPAEEMP